MVNERMMILEMVKDGKISVDDGVKLLNAIKQPTNSNFDDFTSDIKYKFQNIPKPDAEKIKENAQVFFNKTEEMFEEVGKTLKEFFSPNQNNQNKTQDNVENNNTQNTNTEFIIIDKEDKTQE